MANVFENTLAQFINTNLDKRLHSRIVVRTSRNFVVKFDNITNSVVWSIDRKKCKLGWFYDSSVYAALSPELGDYLYSDYMESRRYKWGQPLLQQLPLDRPHSL